MRMFTVLSPSSVNLDSRVMVPDLLLMKVVMNPSPVPFIFEQTLRGKRSSSTEGIKDSGGGSAGRAVSSYEHQRSAVQIPSATSMNNFEPILIDKIQQ